MTDDQMTTLRRRKANQMQFENSSISTLFKPNQPVENFSDHMDN